MSMWTLPVSSKNHTEMIDITADIQQLLEEQSITSGVCVVFVPHTTAGITINEGADPSVQRDILTTLDRLVPHNGDYHHREGNSDAHIKASLVGSSISIFVDNGSLVLGTWQHIFFFEGDGPRNRKVYMEIYNQR